MGEKMCTVVASLNVTVVIYGSVSDEVVVNVKVTFYRVVYSRLLEVYQS